jgi:hypothetical protein
MLGDEPTAADGRGEREHTPEAGRAMFARLRPREFIQRTGVAAQQALRAQRLDFNLQVRGRLLKLWAGSDMSVHYEVAVHEREMQLEVGLHMEADAARNAALYREFDRCLLDLQAELGERLWLERWDRGWARLYETEPLWPLDELRVEAVATRLVELIAVIQPVCEAIVEQLGG